MITSTLVYGLPRFIRYVKVLVQLLDHQIAAHRAFGSQDIFNVMLQLITSCDCLSWNGVVLVLGELDLR